MSLPMGTLARPSMGSAQSRAKLKSRHDSATAKAQKVLSDRRAAYRLVDIRDANVCRAFKVKVSPFAVNPDHRKEHHHILGRGSKDSESTENICTLSKKAHDLVHVKRTLTIVGNANAALLFELDGRSWQG